MKPIQAKKTAQCFTTALFLGFIITNPASAQGFSLSGFVSESLDYTDNAALDAVSQGATLTSSTSIGLNLLSETPVSSFALNGSTFLFIARNPDGSVNREFGYPSLSASFSDSTSSRNFSIGASYQISPAGNGSTFIIDDVNDDGIVDPGEVTVLLTDARQITYALNASYSTDVTARDTVRVTARASFVSFDGNDPDLIASDRQTLRLGWNHQIADDLTGGLALSGSWFRNEAVAPVFSTTTSLSGNVKYDVNSTTILGVDLGISKTDVDEGTGTATTYSLNGGAKLDVALADGSFGAAVKFGVEPSDGGELRQRVSLGIDYSRTINSVSSLSVSLDMAAAGDIGGPFGSGERSLSLTPTYRRQLTDDTSANIGLRYERVGSNPGADSKAIFVGLSKNFEFLQ